MSGLLDKFSYFVGRRQVKFSDGHGTTVTENRDWEHGYRHRWQHDKIVRSTHGTNCTGSCSWKIYVKNGMITWETQQTDYPRTRYDLPNHEPRGCQRGASYSWYIYSAARLKHPMVRGALVKLWREARTTYSDPVKAWEHLVTDPASTQAYKTERGMGGFIRSSWDEVNEIIAAANIYTAKEYGPDRISGFSPIPAMSMVSYAAGTRYLSLIGGTCLSFYDWYCDLPPSSPQTWGEQTDVPESADWYSSSFLMMWGSNVPQTRTPDAHFMSEARYSGTKTVVVTPDYSEAAKFSDIWLHPKQGTDAALAMAMGHVILKKFFVDKKTEYFDDYCRRFTDMPFLVRLKKVEDYYVPENFIRASDFAGSIDEENNPEWKTLVIDSKTDAFVVPNGTIGSRWGEKGHWNLETKNLNTGEDIWPVLSLMETKEDVLNVAFPYFGNRENEHYTHTDHDDISLRNIPVRKVQLEEGETFIATVFDLFMANYGVDAGLGGENIAQSFDDDQPYTPAWQERITGVKRADVISVATQFAENAEKTEGRSMIIVGAAMNHWYHMDMNYRSLINMLVMCGCVGKSGGGWAHYVGQEKLRPQTGWTPLAFALDWQRPPRHMNGTSFFYAHSSQWRYEKLRMGEILSPLADDKEDWDKMSLIDCNAKAERLGWLPSCPELQDNPLGISKKAEAANQSVSDYVVDQLKSGDLKMSCDDPDNPKNFPRNLFVWRSNLLGSSGKGHEYLLKYLLGTQNGIQGEDLGRLSAQKPSEVVWHDDAPEGKLDLLVTLDFRMSTTALYSDIVLPAASWYEKNDLNTSDMHPFIHPLSAAIDPVWESRSDWSIYKGLAEKFSELCPGHLGCEEDVVLLPMQHDTPMELGQTNNVKDWKKGECDPIPGKTMPKIVPIKRDYPNTYKKFCSIGPLLDTIGNGGKGIDWNTQHEVEELRQLNYTVTDETNIAFGQPKLETDIHAAEMILSLAPETNGAVAVKAWSALGEFTGRDHTHLATKREDEKIRYRDVQAQPRKIISSPTWSGIESEEVSYNAGYTNVHELIPWRTLTGRQELYQDHAWMRAFGESLCVYKPPIDTKTIHPIMKTKGEDRKQVALSFITPHQKWGIHSTYTDNLIMLTLSRGGPIIWLSEIDAAKIGIEDNDWIEAYNVNGAIAARAVVSQRVPEGMCMMYHAQEKIVNTPLCETTKGRGGIHNSVTRVCTKPTHMIGGYAQLSYGFNYYGTVGCNRDEFVIIRKLEKVEWVREVK
jgi:nitrate reductase / nitrite oxidoreductase, alpha subunit